MLGDMLAIRLTMLLVLLTAATVRAAPAFDPAAVDASIENAKAYLYAEQNEAGTWENVPAPQNPAGQSAGLAAQDTDVGQWGGRTSLALYALLAAGEKPTEPRLQKAVEFVKTQPITGTYAVGVKMLALSYLPIDGDVKRSASAGAQVLLQTVKTQGEAAGHYDYNALVRDDGDVYSHSRSQYGLLGLWAASRMGYDVPANYWRLCDAGWRRNQRRDGGWGYMATGRYDEPTLGMTAAGVASLFITVDEVLDPRARACNGNVVDPNVDAGLAWVARNFELFDPETEYARDWKYPTLYALERIGAASGLRSIGGNDWYARGVGWLLPWQRKNGSFTGAGKSRAGESGGVVDTSFALLFLGRGRSPILASKLAHAGAGERRADWNQRPRDLANLAAVAGQGIERELHWQIVSPESSPESWLEGPMLYLSGSDALDLGDNVKAKLREFASKGGLIVLNADCGRPGFAKSAEALGDELFPDYDWRVLEGSSPIYSMQFDLAKARRPVRVMALGNGARELMVLVDKADLGRDWQTRDETALQFGTNLYLYAVDRDGQRSKGRTHLVTADPAKTPSREAAVGRVKYEGNWDPEPCGWDRLAAVMHNDYDTAVAVKAVDPAADDLAGLDLLHLTGTGEFTLEPAAREKIKVFVDGGGTLLVDAAGGSAAFATAAERELRAVFGDEADQLTQPAGELEMFGEVEGVPPLRVSWRLAAVMALGGPDGLLVRAIVKDGRPAVLWSAQDLSVGLVGMPVAGVVGYAPETATALVARVVRSTVKSAN